MFQYLYQLVLYILTSFNYFVNTKNAEDKLRMILTELAEI